MKSEPQATFHVLPKTSLMNQLLRRVAGSPMLSAIVSGLFLLIYAGQLNLGRWQVDEFLYFTNQRQHGVYAAINRLYVSPRPFSESLIYLYGQSVLAVGRPLVTEVLALLWTGLVVGMVLAARASLKPSPLRLATAFSLAMALMVFVMATNPITEVFFWPVASVAYLPTVGGAVALLFLLDDEPEPRRRLWCGVALTVAVISHEIGAALAIGIAVAATGRALVAPRRFSASLSSGLIAGILDNVWWVVPALIGLCVMVGLVMFRSANIDLGSNTKPYTGHLTASALAAAWQLAIDIVTTGYSGVSFLGIMSALVIKALFAMGFALVWLSAGNVRLGFWRMAFAFGLVVAAFFSLFAAFYHYGDLCCERHSTTRQWLLDLLWIVAAVGVIKRLRQLPTVTQWWPRLRWFGPGILALSLFPVILQAGGIRLDYRFLAMARQARARTWASGQQPGTNRMLFYLPPDSSGMLVRGTSEHINTYAVPGKTPELITAVGRFFGKSVVTTCQPWQGDRSWLYDGRFIPACPPHPGPPDIIYNSD